MIIVISCSHFPDDERIYHRQIKALLLNGFKVRYYTRSSSSKNLSDVGLEHFNFSSALSISNYSKRVFYDVSKNKKTALVHIHEPELLSLAINIKKIFGSKIIYDVHEDYCAIINTFSRWGKPIRYLKEKYWLKKEKWFLRYVDEIIVASNAIMNSDYNSQGFKPIVLENFPVNFFFDGLKIKKKIKNSIIYHGNLAPERGILELVKAMPIVISQIPDATLTLFGDFRLDSFKNSLHKAIKILDMSKHINLKKHIPHADIWLHLSNHAVGVIPFNDNSLTRIGTPTKLFEFMASGCQVVCPNLPPMMRYDFKGINFFTPGDVNELANTIINAIRNISRDDILYNQKKIKSDYNWDNISFRLINLYNRLLS